jgi:DNA repair protein RecO (recombination protein O)
VFDGIRSSSIRIYGGLYAAELIHALTLEYDPHPELFDALLRFLRQVARNGTPLRPTPQPNPATESESPEPDAEIVRFQADLLKSIGYAPVLRQCVACGKPRRRGEAANFSSSAGGLLCPACAPAQREKHAIDSAIVDGPKGSTKPVQWFALLDYHLTCIAGRPLSVSRQLHALLQPR